MLRTVRRETSPVLKRNAPVNWVRKNFNCRRQRCFEMYFLGPVLCQANLPDFISPTIASTEAMTASREEREFVQPSSRILSVLRL